MQRRINHRPKNSLDEAHKISAPVLKGAGLLLKVRHVAFAGVLGDVLPPLVAT